MRILLVDDEELSRKPIVDFLSVQLGHQVTECENGIEALKIFNNDPFPMVITDIRMPTINGIDLLREIKKLPTGRITDVVLITGFGDVNSAIQALRAGAYDYMLKPIEVEELAAVVNRISEHQMLLQENRELKFNFEQKVHEATTEMKEKYHQLQQAYSNVIRGGKMGIFSEKMKRVTELAEKFHTDRSIPVLIEGETGTGKEVFARLVHFGQGDTTSPFVALNCSTIAPTLVETELFGYDEGAFTNAKKKGSHGKLELANHGSLFLDEICDLPQNIQPKLLRVIEEKDFYRVGGLKKISLDVRFICATNSDLRKRIKEGAFRQDLYYRLNVGHIIIPPLRERTEEIGPLAQMFLEQLVEKKKKNFQTFHPEAIKILENHHWPGNVRELHNAIERVVLLFDDTQVKPEYLSFVNSKNDVLYRQGDRSLDLGNFIFPPAKLDLKNLEREIVQRVLKKFNNNKTRTAQYLGITRSALRSKLK